MSYKVADPYSKEFVTSSPTTGAAANADTTPVATADFDGAGSGAMALTVTNLDAGRYKITGTIPGTRARGDVLNVSVAAIVGGVTGKAIVDTQVLDSKRVGDLNDAPVLTDYQQRAVAVTLPTIPADWIAAAGVSAAAVTKVQAGLSTYAGGDTAGTTTLLARLTGPRAAGLDNLDVAVSTRSTYAGGAVASVSAPVSINLAQVGLTPRDLGAVADSGLTVGDALVAAICGAAGKEGVVGTAYTVRTPSTGTTIRVFTLNSSSAPTSRS